MFKRRRTGSPTVQAWVGSTSLDPAAQQMRKIEQLGPRPSDVSPGPVRLFEVAFTSGTAARISAHGHDFGQTHLSYKRSGCSEYADSRYTTLWTEGAAVWYDSKDPEGVWKWYKRENRTPMLVIRTEHVHSIRDVTDEVAE